MKEISKTPETIERVSRRTFFKNALAKTALLGAMILSTDCEKKNSTDEKLQTNLDHILGYLTKQPPQLGYIRTEDETTLKVKLYSANVFLRDKTSVNLSYTVAEPMNNDTATSQPTLKIQAHYPVEDDKNKQIIRTTIDVGANGLKRHELDVTSIDFLDGIDVVSKKASKLSECDDLTIKYLNQEYTQLTDAILNALAN